ncbi:GHKL domain-containing protein [Marinilabiliaceae bacterium JC017]|nr:GHKL domain-containing protein [Marinilabiliaceae bacterium JC017]
MNLVSEQLKRFSGTHQRWFFFLAICGWFMGFLFQELETRKLIPEINIGSVESVIGLEQQKLREELRLLDRELLDESNDIWELMEALSEMPRSYLVYENKELIAWSDPDIPLQNKSLSIFDKPVEQLGNGWYLNEKITTNKYTLIGLFRMKEEYQYQNEFVVNRFDDRINAPSSARITEDVSSGYVIHGTDGQELFSILTDPLGKSVSIFFGISALFFLFGVVFTLLLTGVILRQMVVKKWGNWSFIPAAMVCAGIYFWFITTGIMQAARLFDLFSSASFAATWWLPSMGAFLFLAFLVFVYSFWILRLFQVPAFVRKNEGNFLLMTGFWGILVIGLMFYFLILDHLVFLLVEDSSSVALMFRVLDMDVVALSKIAIITFLYLSFVFLLERVVMAFYPRLSVKRMAMVVLVLGLLMLLVRWIFVGYNFIDIGFFILIALFFIGVKGSSRNIHTYGTFVWFVFLFALYVTVELLNLNISKEHRNRELLVENLSFKLMREEDPVAEMYLEALEDKLHEDVFLRENLEENEIDEKEIADYLKKNYFVGYLSRYDLQVVPCWPQGELYVEGSNETYNCYDYFSEMIAHYGVQLPNSDQFYFLDNENGRVSYFGSITYSEGDPENEICLFIELNSKPMFEGLGYPALLTNDRDRLIMNVMEDYSYAKYVDGNLVRQFGDFKYGVKADPGNIHRDTTKYYIEKNGVSHLVYNQEDNVAIVLSRDKVSFSQVLIGFSTLFIAFFLVAAFCYMIIKIKKGRPFFRFTIQERIQISFIGLVLVLLVLMGVGSVTYSTYQFKKKNNEAMSQRIKSVLLEVEQKIGNEPYLKADMQDYLQYLLQKFSNVFFCDINMFDLKGKLLATSRPELYNKEITGTLMTPTAIVELSNYRKTEFIHEESIGSLKYTSAYVPVFNRDNQVLAYLNMPYFVGGDELKEQVSSLVVAVINAYLIFVMLAISVAVIVSKRITHPLMVVQTRLGHISLSQKNEKIAYKGKDEIGELVKGYNRMVDELGDSAEKLAQSERESAWREMARQIAHEIKNPLTPMKLNVQYLLKARKDKVADFDRYLERVSSSLIEQIDQLSVIATEFSNFAKMPVAKREPVDLVSKLHTTISLFEKMDNIKFVENLNNHERVMVYADRDQMLSVFNNILKNAVQSIPPKAEGIIKIALDTSLSKVHISIADNGRGMTEEIKEKVFRPNFTTKSGGMGLGLAIVKNIINNTKGHIWFETQEGVGTTFFIELPLYHESV